MKKVAFLAVFLVVSFPFFAFGQKSQMDVGFAPKIRLKQK